MESTFVKAIVAVVVIVVLFGVAPFLLLKKGNKGNPNEGGQDTDASADAYSGKKKPKL